MASGNHPRAKARLEFDIDFDMGTVTDLVAQNINASMWGQVFDEWRNEPASLAEFAWQQSYPAPDPLHNPQSFAWKMMARGWVLLGDLAQHDAPLPDELPEGALA